MEYKCINEPIPVTNNNQSKDNWSNKSPKSHLKLCTEIQSNKVISIGLVLGLNCVKK